MIPLSVLAAVSRRRRGRRLRGFDPRGLGALGVWYHPAAQDVVKDAVSGATSRYIDLSGAGNDAIQFTGANQGVWSAGAFAAGPGITFTGGGSMTGPVLDLSAGFLISTRVKSSSFAAGPTFLKIDDGTDAKRLWVFFSTTGQLCVRVFQSATVYIGCRTAASYVSTGEELLLSVAWDGTASRTGLELYVNGVRADTLGDSSGAFTGITATTAPLVIGTGLGGPMGDLLVYTQPHADSDRLDLEAALSGARPLFVPNTPPPKFGGDVYFATTGKATAAGTLADPLDLATILSKGVGAGTNVWGRGGTYSLDMVVNFAGTAATPTVIRAYNHERVTIDGSYRSNGAYIWLWDFEVMYSETTRTTTQAGSDPTDVPRQGRTTYIAAPGNKVLNCFLHDLGDGLFAGEEADGLEIHGSLVWNNGWDGPDRGHGHALYQQNRTSTRSVTDNVLFNQFSTGLKCGGTGSAAILHFDMRGNASFMNGALSTHGLTWNLDVEGGTPLGESTWDTCSFFHTDGLAGTVRLAIAADTPGANLTFTNNIVHGPPQFNDATGYVGTGNKITTGSAPLNDGQTELMTVRIPSGYDHTLNTFDHNSYATPGGAGLKNPFYYALTGGTATVYDFAGWKAATGYDANSTFLSGEFSGSDIIVRPNKYEAGRGLVHCWNWDQVASLDVDLSTILAVGDAYEVHHVYDPWGAPVVSGTYDGNPVALPQTGYVAPTPVGMAQPGASAAPKFNVFLVRKTG